MKLSNQQEAIEYLNTQVIPPINGSLSSIKAGVGEVEILDTFTVGDNEGNPKYQAWKWQAKGLPLLSFGTNYWLFDDGTIDTLSINDVNAKLYGMEPSLKPILGSDETQVLEAYRDGKDIS